MMKIKTVCPICGKVNYVEVPAEGFCKWQEEGMPIQFAMPELSANEREMLKTGICPTCWDKMWSEDTEEDEDEDFDEEDLCGDLEDIFDFLMGGEDEDPDSTPSAILYPNLKKKNRLTP